MPTTIPVLRFSSTRCLMSASTAESDGKPGSFARAACCACAASVVERDEANSDTRLPIRSSRDEDMTRSGLTRRCVGAKHMGPRNGESFNFLGAMSIHRGERAPLSIHHTGCWPMSRSHWNVVLIALTATTAVAPVRAQDVNLPLEVHGFGGWSMGRTTKGNVYLGGLPEGDYRLSEFALNIAATPANNFRVYAQSEWREDDRGTHLALDYAFAEVKFSDAIKLRVGQVKHPFGLYNEVFTVGTLRPFYSLPQALYGPVGFAGQSYKGVGVTGSHQLGSRWRTDYDFYAGGTDLQKAFVSEAIFHGDPIIEDGEEIELESTRNVVGTHLTLHTPISGLSIGSSLYTGILNEEASNRRSVVAGQMEYETDRLSIRSEVAHSNQVGDEKATGYYVETAYRLTEHWQAAVQANRLDNNFFGADQSVAPSLAWHKEGVVGVSYWVTPALVFKLDVHRVDGNRFSMPKSDEVIAAVQAGE